MCVAHQPTCLSVVQKCATSDGAPTAPQQGASWVFRVTPRGSPGGRLCAATVPQLQTRTETHFINKAVVEFKLLDANRSEMNQIAA